MSPRRNRQTRGSRRAEPAPGAPSAPGAVDDEQFGDRVRQRLGIPMIADAPDGQWLVRQVPPGAATKIYRCPGCDQEIRPGVAHLVCWPAEGDPGDRRHWHSGCWRARDRRVPGVQRSRSAPRYG